MRPDRDYSPRTAIRAWACALALGCLSLTAHAVNKANIGTMMAGGSGRTVTLNQAGKGAAGDSTIPISPNMGGWTTANNYGVPPAATGPTMNMDTQGNVFYSGVKYPFMAKYSPKWSDFAPSALGVVSSFGCSLIVSPLGAAACVVAASAAVPYIFDWMTRSGGRLDPSTGQWQRKDQNVCTVAPCTQYGYIIPGYSPVWLGSDPSAVCGPYGDALNAITAPAQRKNPRYVGGLCVWDWFPDGVNQSGTAVNTPASQPVPPAGSAAWLPSSMSDILPYMTNLTPDGRVFRELLDNGQEVDLGTPTVTGPASVDGPETVKQNQDGTKQVSKTTYNFTTQGNQITNTSNTTTTNTYNTSNQITDTTTTTVTPSANTPAQPQDQDKRSECEKSPNALGCAELDTPSLDIPRDSRSVSYQEQNLFGGGSCPADVNVSLQTIGRTLKAWDWQKTCQWSLPIKAILLIVATFFAFMIVLPGSKPA